MSIHTVIVVTLCLNVCGPATLKVYDGDTFRLGREPIRIENIDTPEIKGKCYTEKLLAQKAKARLVELLQTGEVRIIRSGKDKYRRTLARITVGGSDVGRMLVKDGLARVWTGKRLSWCLG